MQLRPSQPCKRDENRFPVCSQPQQLQKTSKSHPSSHPLSHLNVKGTTEQQGVEVMSHGKESYHNAAHTTTIGLSASFGTWQVNHMHAHTQTHSASSNQAPPPSQMYWLNKSLFRQAVQLLAGYGLQTPLQWDQGWVQTRLPAIKR